MVSINGIQLKNVKEFRGMEGNGFNATVYMDGKKIGTADDSGFGSGIDFSILPQYRDEFYKRTDSVEDPYNAESFITRILDLVVIEKSFKKSVKKYPKSNPVTIAVFSEAFKGAGEKTFSGKIYTAVEKCVNEVIAKEIGNDCKVFRTLTDFSTTMISEEQLGKIIKEWNPETGSVNIIRDAIKEYGRDVWAIDNDSLLNAIMNLTWAEKYYNEYAFSAVSEHFCILSIDFEGNCLYGDWDEVKHISKLEESFYTWIKEQEAENASNKN